MPDTNKTLRHFKVQVIFTYSLSYGLDVMALLRPLLMDNVPSIQQSAALALGRLAGYNEELADAIVNEKILPTLVKSLEEQNKHYKKTAAYVLQNVARHNSTLAKNVVDAKALQYLMFCLEDFDPAVKTAAAWAIAFIAKHSEELARAVVDAGGVEYLVACV